ncbi:MAG: peptide ligase PGM1-related protein [Spirosomataceae bacterium]
MTSRLTPPASDSTPASLPPFVVLQQSLKEQFERAFPDPLAPKTVIVLPSLTLDQEILKKLEGHIHYEERMLSMLMLLRMPRTQVIFLSSMPIDPVIVDYYLHLLPGITGWHARKRLVMLSCFDASAQSLTEKILARPRFIETIKRHIPTDHAVHLAAYNVTQQERTLAEVLHVPLYGCDPALSYLGTKSGSRAVFQEVGIPMPAGYENLHDELEIAEALTALKQANRSLRKAVVKLNDGFSGEGNAVFSYKGAPEKGLCKWVKAQLPKRLRMIAPELSYEVFMQKFVEMGGIVEAFLEGAIKTSPSVQCRITPTGKAEVISTHDQVLGGESGQVFLGASFPAHAQYRQAIGQMGLAVAQQLADYGVMGRFSVDFVSVLQQKQWKHYGIEINLRKGGTTHPYLMLQFLTDGQYNVDTGDYLTPTGQKRYYFATDNLKNPAYKQLTPYDLMDLSICQGLHYDGVTQEGVMFHLMGALSEFGKIGVVCIGKTPERATEIYQKTVRLLDEATHTITEC